MSLDRSRVVLGGYGECPGCGRGAKPPTEVLWLIPEAPEHPALCEQCAAERLEEEDRK